MSETKTTPAPEERSYPAYKKNGRTYICVITEKKFVQILFKEQYSSIMAGESKEVVDSCFQYGSTVTRKEYEMAYLNVMQMISAFDTVAQSITPKIISNGNTIIRP